MAAVASVEAARWGANLNIKAGTFPALSSAQLAKVIEDQEVDVLRKFESAKLSARGALAVLHPYSPDLKRFWDKNEAPLESEFNELMTLLADRREKVLEQAVRKEKGRRRPLGRGGS